MSIIQSFKGLGFSAYFTVCAGHISLRRPDAEMSQVRAEQKADRLLKRLYELKYSKSTIKGDQWFLSKIKRTFSEKESGMTRFSQYQILYAFYSSAPKYRPELVIVRRWMLFDLYDVMPLKTHVRANRSNTVYDYLTPYFQACLNDYVRLSAPNKKESTIRSEIGALSRFLYYVQCHGMNTIDEIQESTIRNYKVSSGWSNPVIHRIAGMVMLISPQHPKFSIPLKHEKIVYEGLSSEEFRIFQHYIHTSDEITHLERVVCMMCLYYGPRNEDLAQLKSTDIHWDSNYFEFRQQKTGRYVRYPLIAVIGNALRRYLNIERPEFDSPLVFLSPRCYQGRYAQIHPDKIVNRVYRKCGIRDGDARKGTHILRHAMATRMMALGEDLSIIADVLGHSKPNSSLTYLSTDIEALRRCALDISRFNLNASVYEE